MARVIVEPQPEISLSEALRHWDNGDPVFTVEMGGLGPGYEQTIQVLMWEIVRDYLGKKPLDQRANFGYATMLKHNNALGLSGAQFGAAKGLAWSFLSLGYQETLKKAGTDRLIQVSTFWPRIEVQP